MRCAKDLAKKTLSKVFGRDVSRIAKKHTTRCKLVTFDVFDTLVIRSCGDPEKVFDLVEEVAVECGLLEKDKDWRKERIAAEKAARKIVGHNREVRLDEIYAHIPFLSAQTRKAIMELELSCELAVLKPNPALVECFNRLKRTKRVAIVSDTYLPSWFVALVLDECGIKGYERLYVSSEYGCMKRNGDLFGAVLMDFSVSPESVLHIGDHPKADWLSPRKIGLKAHLLGLDTRRGYMRNSDSIAGNKRVAIYSESWIVGGIESFIINELLAGVSKKFDITIISTWGDSSHCDELLSRLGVGRQIYYEGSKPNIAVRTVRGLLEFSRLTSDGLFDVVHVNTQNGVGHAYAWIAKRKGVPIRIVHSHSSWFGGGAKVVRCFVHVVTRSLFGSAANVRIACSTDAGRHVFGGRTFEVLRNGIDGDRFRYDEEVRLAMRDFLGVDSSVFLLGSVGRISQEKDPLFQLQVFSELRRKRPNTKYLMVGSGELDEAVDSLIQDLDLTGSAIRVPVTDSPEKYLCALDAFVFPSVFEGLPIAAIEAQSTGLPVLAASHLTSELEVTDLVTWVDKKEGPEGWAKELLGFEVVENREKYADQVAKCGYSSSNMASRIFQLYQGVIAEEKEW